MRARLAAAIVALAAGVVAVVLALFLAHSALADGDPASDVLISQPVFLPLSVNFSTAAGGELAALVEDAKAKGFPLKVAVIATKNDLGSVPSLYGTPQRYASFLGQEDYYFFKDTLLVVMPQGYGLYKAGGVPPAVKRAIAKLPPPHVATGDELIAAAGRAVRSLAAQRGLTLSSASESHSSATRDRIEIAAGVLVLCALAVAIRTVVRRR